VRELILPSWTFAKGGWLLDARYLYGRWDLRRQQNMSLNTGGESSRGDSKAMCFDRVWMVSWMESTENSDS